MVPDGWNKHPVGKLCTSIVPGRNKPKIFDGTIPWVTTPEIKGRYLPSVAQKNYVSEEALKEAGGKVIPEGAVVMAAVGELGLVAIAKEKIALNQQLHAFVCSPIIHNEYLAYWLETQKPYMLSIASKTTIPYLNKTNCESISVTFPSKDEQKKIANILSTWDKAITTTELLLTNSQKQKKALMQQLLTGKKRLLDENGDRFSGKWMTYKFGTVFSERVETGRNELPLLSITADDGVMYQADTGRKNTSNEDKSKYRRICINDIGYNTMRMWQGRSSLSNKEGIVSPAYTIVTPGEQVVPSFAAYLFKLPTLIHIFYRHSQGLVSDTWNLKFNHFKNVSWAFPDTNEQRKIATVLSAADQEITLLKHMLDKLKLEKNSLMQQLLTGKRRVIIEEKELSK